MPRIMARKMAAQKASLDANQRMSATNQPSRQNSLACGRSKKEASDEKNLRLTGTRRHARTIPGIPGSDKRSRAARSADLLETHDKLLLPG